MRELQCPKCDGKMSQGFVPDFANDGVHIGVWHQGEPRPAFFFGGIKRPASAAGIPIGAFRCTRCGYLEFYANAEFAAE